MKTFTAGVAAGAMAATVGFVGHVSSREFVQSWVGSQMAGRQVAPSWDVRYLAWATSLEMGLGLVLLYALVRRVLPARTSVMRGVLMAGLLLAITGRLFRQPLMNLAIGNPGSVVIVQDGITWLLWLAMSVTVATVFDRLAPMPDSSCPSRTNE